MENKGTNDQWGGEGTLGSGIHETSYNQNSEMCSLTLKI
jgi:hypothetical protein